MENAHQLEAVQSAEGKKVRDLLIQAATDLGYHLRCSGKSFVPHVQFRRKPLERPYPFSLSLNPEIPTFYVRRPTPEQRTQLLNQYDGAHLNRSREIKIPISNCVTAKRVIEELLS